MTVSRLSRDRVSSQELQNCDSGQKNITFGLGGLLSFLRNLKKSSLSPIEALEAPQDSHVPKVFSGSSAPGEKMLQLWGRETLVGTEKPH